MNEPLRPSNLGEILDRTAQIYRTRFLVFLGIGIIPTGSLMLFAAAIFLVVYWIGVSDPQATPDATKVFEIVLLAVAGIFFVPSAVGVSALSTAAMNHAVARTIIDEKPTIRGAYADAWRRGWHFVWLYLLEALMTWVAPMAVWIVLVIVSTGLGALMRAAGMGLSGGAFVGLLVILVALALSAYALWMLLRLSLAFPACIVEKIGAWTAIQRSIKLSLGSRGRIFVLYLLGVALAWILSIAVTVPLTIAMENVPGFNNPQHAQTAGTILILAIYGASFAVQAFIKPVYGIALMLFYYDQRIRQEGLDIEWMMQRAGMFAPPPETVSSPEVHYASESSPPTHANPG